MGDTIMNMFKKMSAKQIVACVVVLAVLAVGGVLLARKYVGLLPASDSQFAHDSAPAAAALGQLAKSGQKMQLNPDGTIKYLNENFQGYLGKSQAIVAPFNGTSGVTTSGTSGSLSTQKDAYEGASSLAVRLVKSDQKQSTVTQLLSNPLDLSNWQTSGYATMWLRVDNRIGISSIALRLKDASGNYREYAALPNLQTNYPNTIENDPFQELPFEQPGLTTNWTDYMLAPGWNYLPWRADTGNFTDHGSIDMHKITSAEVVFNTTSQLAPQTVLLNDLRMVSGLQNTGNEVGGNWYPPLEAGQYGVYDVNQSKGQAALKLLNVRQSQYPSNGDHGRLLSKGGTPLNFAMKLRFSANNLSSDTNNTYLRFLYDFDPSYDPGHDWFGAYMSLDYKKIGLLTVKPLERFTIQTQEPLNSTTNASYRQDFKPKADQQYELDVTVHGQQNQTTLYAVDGSKLRKITTLDYTFKRPREKKRNPLGFEVTGNAKLTFSDVELVQL